MRQILSGVLAVTGILFLIGTAQADPMLVHQHVGLANPTTEGWDSLGAGYGVAVGPVDDGGVEAWFVDDNSTVVGSGLMYRGLLSPEDLQNAALGWCLAFRLRTPDVPDAPGGSPMVLFQNGNVRYQIHIGSDSNGDPVVRQQGSGTVNLPGLGNGYHYYEMVLIPAVATTATLWVDGQVRATGYSGYAFSTTEPAVLWGAGSSGDTGQGNFSRVEFYTLWEGPIVFDQDKLCDDPSEGYILYYGDLDFDGWHDPNEPWYSWPAPAANDWNKDNSCWMASAANMLCSAGQTNPYLTWLGEGAAPSPATSPWGWISTAPGGGAAMTFDDGGYQHWAILHAGESLDGPVVADSAFVPGTWSMDPLAWCETVLDAGQPIGLAAWWGSVPKGTLPGRVDLAQDYCYHAITLWAIDETAGTITITDSDDGILGPRDVAFASGAGDWILLDLYPGRDAHVNYAVAVGTPTSVPGDFSRLEPAASTFLNARPNPFRSGTTVQFHLPSAALARLTVFDVAGRPVRVLVDSERLEQGLYDIPWDGRSDDGKVAAAGVYFYRLETGREVTTCRVVRLR